MVVFEVARIRLPCIPLRGTGYKVGEKSDDVCTAVPYGTGGCEAAPFFAPQWGVVGAGVMF